MKALSKILVSAVTASLMTVSVAYADGAVPAKAIYNEQADARAELNVALAQAHAQKKNVLVVFGANWCKDCHSLSERMSGPLAKAMDQRFVVLKVDVGRFTKNLDLAEQMGVPLKKGIPAVAVLKNNGEMASATGGGELADARSMGDEAVLKVFDGLKAN